MVALWVTNRERHRRFIDEGEGLSGCCRAYRRRVQWRRHAVEVVLRSPRLPLAVVECFMPRCDAPDDAVSGRCAALPCRAFAGVGAEPSDHLALAQGYRWWRAGRAPGELVGPGWGIGE